MSKWERGLNFPDLSLIEPLAKQLGVSAAELLGLKEKSSVEAVSQMVLLSSEQEKKVRRQLILRAVTDLCAGLLILGIFLYISRYIFDHEIFEIQTPLAFLLIGWIVVTSNALYTLRILFSRKKLHPRQKI